MSYELLSMIFELAAVKMIYICLSGINTEKHRFLYDRMILEPSNYDFWSRWNIMIWFFSKIIIFFEHHDYQKKVIIFEKSQDFRKEVMKVDFFRESQLFSKKSTFFEKINFSRLFFRYFFLENHDFDIVVFSMIEWS